MIDDWRKTIPTVTRDQMVEVDRLMIEDLGIELLQMMPRQVHEDLRA
jgi:hypothetical protein